MTKIIRILTGRQCGAKLDLSPGRWMIGSKSESDIRLSDWQGDALIIECYEDGRVTLERPLEDGLKRFPDVLRDWVPIRRSDIVLCVGPADVPWPADADLLEKLFAAPDNATHLPGPLPRSKPIVLKICTAACAVFVSAVVAVSALTTRHSDAAVVGSLPQVRSPTQLSVVRTALMRLGQSELVASDSDSGVVVSGMVNTLRDAQTVRTMLTALQGNPVTTRFLVAESIAEDLRAAAGEPAVKVGYVGHGIFRVTGTALAPERIRVALSAAAADYGGHQVRLQFDLHAAVVTRNVLSVIDTQAISYVELPDGTKEFSTRLSNSGN
jgi:type III secretion protein D